MSSKILKGAYQDIIFYLRENGSHRYSAEKSVQTENIAVNLVSYLGKITSRIAADKRKITRKRRSQKLI